MNEPYSQFIEPWIQETSSAFIKELIKEVSIEHILFGEELEVVSRRIDNDDVLFKFKRSEDKYVQVHLIWKMSKELSPDWPKSIIYYSFEEWIENVMKIDNKEYEE
ncbi:hypothetical protein [Cohnella thailandensis]|uniref:Uncharacterized protein n=1 Tax=Cohnella thailandensis TaxID=557557 RepID=A0A841SZP0_9BACL|nr:hypothetical protein [Cohnella thailandensis]MBB6635300.1 hypothetical protein [Cohnella thailandensis]MBP1974678.1 hypothetical protein [Cohnella thailandensis]